MPMFPEGQDPMGPTGIAQPTVSAPVQPFTPRPTSGDLISAGLTENSVYSAAMALAHSVSEAGIPAEPGYDVMQDIKGTPYETNYLTSFMGSRSSAETAAIKARIEQAQHDRDTLAASGAAGTAMSFGLGILDPVNAIPIAGEVGFGLKEGSIAARAISAAKAGAISSTIGEGVQQATNPTATISQSAQNIGSATLLMGLLGAGHATLFPHEIENATKSMDEIRKDFSPTTPADQVDPNAAPVNPADLGLGQPKPAGAATADTREMIQKPFAPVPQALRDASPIVEKAASAFESVNNALSPIGRLFDSESITARRATADLAETVRGFEQNVPKPILDAEGKQLVDENGQPAFTEPQTTTLDGAVPVDRQSKMVIAKGRVLTNDALTEAYADYRYNGDEPRFSGITQALEEIRGQTPDGKLTYSQFKDLVSQALYSGDLHDIPQVQQAAQKIRAQVLDPIKARGQATIGPDGQPMISSELDAPKGDQSFFPRIWNKVALGAKRNKAVSTISDWLESEQATNRATQSRIESLANSRGALRQTMASIEGRIGTIEKRQRDTVAQQKERVTELNAADSRQRTVEQKHADTQKEIEDLQGHIDAMRGQIRDPEAKMRLDDLESQVADLRAAERKSTAKPGSFDAQDRQEVGGTFANDDFRHAAEVFVGKRKSPKADSFLNYLVREGGVAGGPEEKAVFKDVKRPGLLRKDNRQLLGNDKIRDADDWGEKIQQDFPHAFNGERPTRNEVLDVMRDAAHGKDPWWFHQDQHGNADRETHIQSIVEGLHDTFEHLGEPIPSNLKDLARALNGDGGVKLDDLMEDLRQQDEAGARVPPGVEREAGEARLSQMQAARQEIKDAISRGLKERGQAETQLGKDSARVGEASIPVTRSENRFEDLQSRAERQQMIRDMLEEQRQQARMMHDDLTAKIEAELRNWMGDSAAEAINAMKGRDKAELERDAKIQAGEYEGKGDRLTMADGAVNRAVKRILKSDRDLSKQELTARANEIVDRILSSPDGRLNYENGGAGPDVGAPSGKQQVRSSLNARDFAIPTHMVKEFVEHDTEHAIQSFLRGVVPDILLTDRFGDANLDGVIRKINEDYSAKVAATTSEKAAQTLEKARQNDIRDLAAIRDRIKGVYGWSPDPRMRNAARVAGVFRNWNAIADLGTSVVNRLTDATNGVFRYGLSGMFKNAWAPYFRGLTRISSEDFVGAARRQAKAMSIGIDGHLGHMSHNIADAVDGYRPGSKFENTLQIVADRSMLVNMHSQWTDEVKMMVTSAASAEFLHTAERIATGSATAKDLERMASANITRERAEQIWQEYSKDGGGQKIDGVHVPNTEAWAPAARQSFEAAMGREADASVITTGQEKPLWLSSPVAGLIGQFKGFVSGAHERLLIANLQQRDARTLQGLFTSLATGMVSYRLYTLLSGQQASDRPQDWIKEGIARSAVTGWLTEMNATQARFTGGRTDLYRLIGADRPLSRHDQRSALSELLGPTYSRLEGMSNALGDAAMPKKDGSTNWNAQDTHKMRQILPLQNLFAIRKMLDSAEDGVNNSLGIKTLNRTPQSFQQQ